jgi:hypothetical protein
MRGIGMWPGVDQAVAVGWAAAEEPALLPGLRPHRRRTGRASGEGFEELSNGMGEE